MASHDSRPRILTTDVNRENLLNPPVRQLSSTSLNIWHFPTAAPASLLQECKLLLNAEEQARAARFRFEKDAHRFIVARATVRSILGAYTNAPASELEFTYSRYGKPSLQDSVEDVRFSVSHSGDLALIAVAIGRDVGVDLELIRADVETDKLAERFFSPRERQSLLALPENDRIRGFFRCWTCKEAFLKAQGLGLSRSLSSFDVETSPQLPAHLLATRPAEEEAKLWSLYDVPSDTDYAAAAALQGSSTTIEIMRYR